MLSPEWRFLKTPFSRRLNGELCQRRRRRQRKRHCLTDFAVGRDFFDWRKTGSVECRWISLEFNCWGPPPSLAGEREINLQSCVYVHHKTSLEGISRRSRTVTAKKCTKKCAARAKLLFCWYKPIFCCRSRSHRHRRAKASSWMDENGGFWGK